MTALGAHCLIKVVMSRYGTFPNNITVVRGIKIYGDSSFGGMTVLGEYYLIKVVMSGHETSPNNMTVVRGIKI